MKNLIYKSGMLTVLINVVLMCFLFDCGKDSPTSPAITDINGNWSGRTNQNESVSFTISSNSVTFFKIKIVHPSGASTEVSQNPTNCIVSNNSFSLDFYGNPSVTCKFKSNTTAEGTFTSTWTSSPTTVSGTWTTSKQ
jgi:hypothetical protein